MVKRLTQWKDSVGRGVLHGLLAVCVLGLRGDVTPYGDRATQLDMVLAGKLFALTSWVGTAAWQKLGYELITPQHGLTDAQQAQFVRTYMARVREFQQTENKINQIYIDPTVADKPAATKLLRQQQDALRRQLDQSQNIAESILQEQVQHVLREEGFAWGGQILPPVRFRFTQLPDIIIISRRDKIERIDQRELTTGLAVDEQDQIERAVDKRFDVSSIIEPIGGLGTYPTMLGENSSIEWSIGTIAHEWTHNYLLPSYVGLNYNTDPVARTINETAATLVQREIGKRVLAQFYPELGAVASLSADGFAVGTGADFDFNTVMRETRVRTDALLAQGKIAEAEQYMEERRKLLVQNGFGLRKLNQAYFAFHGAYNAEPGGAPAAGKDPVGPAVQALRGRSRTLGNFVRAIATVQNLEDLGER